MSAVRFGLCVPIFALPGGRLFRTPAYERLDPATTFALAVAADRLGYDSLWVADHLFLGRDDAILEGWTTLCAPRSLSGYPIRAAAGPCDRWLRSARTPHFNQCVSARAPCHRPQCLGLADEANTRTGS